MYIRCGIDIGRMNEDPAIINGYKTNAWADIKIEVANISKYFCDQFLLDCDVQSEKIIGSGMLNIPFWGIFGYISSL